MQSFKDRRNLCSEHWRERTWLNELTGLFQYLGARLVASHTITALEASLSVYTEKFGNDNFTLEYTDPGILSMENAGPYTNGS